MHCMDGGLSAACGTDNADSNLSDAAPSWPAPTFAIRGCPHPMHEDLAVQARTHHSGQQAHAPPETEGEGHLETKVVQDTKANYDLAVLDHFSVVTLNVLSLSEKEQGNKLDPLRQTGQLVFLCKRLVNERISVAFIQESRLTLPDKFGTSSHTVVQNPAVKGIGGLLTLIDKSADIELVSHKTFGPRILCTTLRFRKILVYTINAHAPIRKAPQTVHEEFAARLTEALGSKPTEAILIGGADLNMRVATTPPEVKIAGPWASKCPHGATHAFGLMRALQHAQLVLTNTFLNSSAGQNGCPDLSPQQMQSDEAVLTSEQHATIATWTHPRSKQVFQIDYVLTCSKAHEAVTDCRTLPWAHMDLLTSSDHRGVRATFLLRHEAKRSGAPFPTRSHQSAAHLAAFQEQIRAKMADFQIADNADPVATTLQLQEIAVDVLKATKPRRAQPRQEWIAENTWKHMQSLHALRKLLKVRRHDSKACNLLLPLTLFPANGAPAGLTLPCTITSATWPSYPMWLLGQFARAATRLVRYMLRKDKKEWLNKQCAEGQEFFAHNETGKGFRIIHQLARSKRRRTGGSLLLADGTVTHDTTVVADQWTEYWKGHFNAECYMQLGFKDRTFPLSTQQGTATEFHTTRAEVVGLLKSMNIRSVAPDLCPHKYWKYLEPHLSTTLTAAFNKCMDVGAVPTAWSGSIIIPICKPGKSAMVKESHRPIQLMLMEAKLFSRLLLKNLMRFVSISWLQFARGGVFPPLVAQQQFVSHSRDRGLSCGLIFVDVTAAYDDISHQLMFGPEGDHQTHDLVFEGLRRAGLDHSEASSTQLYIRSYPHHILSNA
eukprot:2054421-Amphidinium_carterae.1